MNWKDSVARELPPVEAPQPVPVARSRAATASLVLGLLSFVAGPLTAVPAVVFGHIGLNRIFRSGGAVGGGVLAVAGIVASLASTALITVAIIYCALRLQSTSETAKQELNQPLRQTQRQAAQMITRSTPSWGRPAAENPSPSRQAPRFSEQIKKNETALVAVLEQLVSAQREFHSRTGRYAGSPKSLGVHCIQDNCYAGYTIRILGLSSSFRIVAEPVAPGQTGAHTFRVDHSGVIRSFPATRV